MARDLGLQGGQARGKQHVAHAAMLRPHPGGVLLAADLVAEHDEDGAARRLPQGDDDVVAGGRADLRDGKRGRPC